MAAPSALAGLGIEAIRLVAHLASFRRGHSLEGEGSRWSGRRSGQHVPDGTRQDGGRSIVLFLDVGRFAEQVERTHDPSLKKSSVAEEFVPVPSLVAFPKMPTKTSGHDCCQHRNQSDQ